MTLQQMEYIVAVEKYRHFVKASIACGVTQSTLSSMIQKLEEELDIQIFDRNSHPVKPTQLGMNIIRQARIILYNTSQLKEMVLTEREQERGEIEMGIIPTVSPYILPKLFKKIHSQYPNIKLCVSESRATTIIQKLERAEIDIAILNTPLNNSNLLEIPIYKEKLVAYISPKEPLYKEKEIDFKNMPTSHLWCVKEGYNINNFSKQDSEYSSIYEAGSIETLVKIVDENGGYAIIPELHVELLRRCQQNQIRTFKDIPPTREISIVIRKDYVKERLLNIIANIICEIVPKQMLDKHIMEFGIKL